MTTAERWAWHTDVYAFRAVTLGLRERISPVDPEGKWFNAEAVETAINRKLMEREYARRQREKTDDQRAGRDIVNQWAQKRGYADMDAYCQMHGIHWIDGYGEVLAEMGVVKRMPRR